MSTIAVYLPEHLREFIETKIQRANSQTSASTSSHFSFRPAGVSPISRRHSSKRYRAYLPKSDTCQE